ncbi:hypothetical protein L211DRAFT_665275 [Terfezia boudieri ATCC MYA-4762]|uniref:Uncharacterized protein n=1 Tax=Terfezia boudieri ATCC MYA-4762 TaxID=1051890 RepID=A0A3N4LBH3_9PEZI|nr:hypothetical protein L211DRAFT_665275 [Terfezia boudieri ATCC MYA-4762]
MQARGFVVKQLRDWNVVDVPLFSTFSRFLLSLLFLTIVIENVRLKKLNISNLPPQSDHCVLTHPAHPPSSSETPPALNETSPALTPTQNCIFISYFCPSVPICIPIPSHINFHIVYMISMLFYCTINHPNPYITRRTES